MTKNKHLSNYLKNLMTSTAVLLSVLGAVSMTAKSAHAAKTKNIMHVANVYNKQGLVSNNLKHAYQPVIVYNRVKMNGQLFDNVGKGQYVASDNIDGTVRVLTHNAWIYDHNAKHIDRKVTLKLGTDVRTYGHWFVIKGKRYYRIGKNRYVKWINFQVNDEYIKQINILAQTNHSSYVLPKVDKNNNINHVNVKLTETPDLTKIQLPNGINLNKQTILQQNQNQLTQPVQDFNQSQSNTHIVDETHNSIPTNSVTNPKHNTQTNTSTTSGTSVNHNSGTEHNPVQTTKPAKPNTNSSKPTTPAESQKPQAKPQNDKVTYNIVFIDSQGNVIKNHSLVGNVGNSVQIPALPTGWVLANPKTNKTIELTKATQPIKISIEHGQVKVTYNHPYVDGTDINSVAKYQHVAQKDLNSTGIHSVDWIMPKELSFDQFKQAFLGSNPVFASDAKHNQMVFDQTKHKMTTVQHINFIRDAIVDTVTGQVIGYTKPDLSNLHLADKDWWSIGPSNYVDLKIPKLTNYYSDYHNGEITIVPKITNSVNYVDDQGNVVLTYSYTGKAGQQFALPELPKGWVLSNPNVVNATNVTLTKDAAPVNIQIKHGILVVKNTEPRDIDGLRSNDLNADGSRIITLSLNGNTDQNDAIIEAFTKTAKSIGALVISNKNQNTISLKQGLSFYRVGLLDEITNKCVGYRYTNSKNQAHDILINSDEYLHTKGWMIDSTKPMYGCSADGRFKSFQLPKVEGVHWSIHRQADGTYSISAQSNKTSNPTKDIASTLTHASTKAVTKDTTSTTVQTTNRASANASSNQVQNTVKAKSTTASQNKQINTQVHNNETQIAQKDSNVTNMQITQAQNTNNSRNNIANKQQKENNVTNVQQDMQKQQNATNLYVQSTIKTKQATNVANQNQVTNTNNNSNSNINNNANNTNFESVTK